MKYLILVLLLILNGCVKENTENRKNNSTLNSHFQIVSSERPIIFTGDTQTTSDWEFWRENNDGIRKKIFAQIAEQNPGCLIIHGDAVFEGSSKGEWDFFCEDILPIRQKEIPVYPVLGNHEYFGDNNAALNNYFSKFPEIKKSKFYSLTYGKNAFLMLNSNFNEMSKSDISMQNRWFKEILEKFNQDKSIKSVFVITHHPPFTNSKAVLENKDVQKYFLDSFISSPKTKIFFSGHCHSFEHFKKSGKHFVVSGGGGGPRQEVETDPDKMKFKDKFMGMGIRPFHYCRLVNSNKNENLEVVFLDEKTGEWKTGYKIILN